MHRKQRYLSPFWGMRGAKDQRGRSLAERGAKTMWLREGIEWEVAENKYSKMNNQHSDLI